VDVVFLGLRPGVPERTQALRAALAGQGIEVGQEHLVQIGAPNGITALAEAVADVPHPGRVVERPVAGGVGSNAVPSRSVALIPLDLVISPGALAALLDDPRVRTGALVVSAGPGAQEFLDVLVIDAADRPAAAGLVYDLNPDHSDQVLLDLLRALSGVGTVVRSVPLTGYLWARPQDRSAAEAAQRSLDGMPERRVRLHAAVRSPEGVYSSLVLRRLSWRLTGLAERLGLGQKQVAAAAFVLGLLAAGLIGYGPRSAVPIGALALQAGLVADRVSSELARFRRRPSRFGVWLQAGASRIVEFAAVFALAEAGARAGQDLWPWAAASMVALTLHGLLGLSWQLRVRPSEISAPEVSWVAPGRTTHGPTPRPRLRRVTFLHRLGRFPIAERMLLLCLGAVLCTPQTTLVLFGAGVLIAAGCLAGWVFEATPVRRQPGPPAPPAADTGLWIGAAVSRVRGRFEPIAAPLVAALELVAVHLLATAAGAQHGAVVVLVAVLGVIHHLHAVGLREGVHEQAGPLPIGADLRIVGLLLLVVAPTQLLSASAAADWATGGVWALTVVVAAVSAGSGLAGWRVAGGR